MRLGGIFHHVEQLVPARVGRLVGMVPRHLALRGDLVERQVVRVAEVAARFHPVVHFPRVPAIQPAGGHGRIGVQGPRVFVHRVSHVHVTAVGNVHRHAEVPEYAVRTRSFTVQRRSQRTSLHMGRRLRIEIVEEGGHQVDRLRERIGPRPGPLVAGQAGDQGNADDLVVQRHDVLHPEVVLGQHGPVVRSEHDQGVFPQPEFVEGIEDPADPVVRHRKQAGVALPDVVDGLGRFAHFIVAGPVEEGSVVIVLVHGPVLIGAIERLVGIEDLDLEEPVVGRPVRLQPLDGRLGGFRSGEILLAPLQPAVAEILLRKLSDVIRQGHAVHVGRPPVVLLAAEEVPRIERRVVVLPAQLEVVVVVGQQVGEDIVLPQLARQGVVVGFDGAPAPVDEVVPPGHEFPPRGHAGERSHPVVVEHDAPLRQAVEGRRVDPAVAVGGQVVPAHGIQHDEYALHADSSFLP